MDPNNSLDRHNNPSAQSSIEQRLQSLEEGLAEVKILLRQLLTETQQKQKLGQSELHRVSYSTEELAAVVGKSSFTVREWCRLGRINATKRQTGRGTS